MDSIHLLFLFVDLDWFSQLKKLPIPHALELLKFYSFFVCTQKFERILKIIKNFAKNFFHLNFAKIYYG
jgi:hypothetical protein